MPVLKCITSCLFSHLIGSFFPIKDLISRSILAPHPRSGIRLLHIHAAISVLATGFLIGIHVLAVYLQRQHMGHPAIPSDAVVGIPIRQVKPIERTVGINIERISVRALVYREITLEKRHSGLIHGNLARCPRARRIIAVLIRFRDRKLPLPVCTRQWESGRQRFIYQAVAFWIDIIEMHIIGPISISTTRHRMVIRVVLVTASSKSHRPGQQQKRR